MYNVLYIYYQKRHLNDLKCYWKTIDQSELGKQDYYKNNVPTKLAMIHLATLKYKYWQKSGKNPLVQVGVGLETTALKLKCFFDQCNFMLTVPMHH